jgi:hypothetical protein
MRMTTKGALAALGTVTTLAGSVALSAPAHAAYTPIGVCGGGDYHVIDTSDYAFDSTVSARTYLLWSSNLGENCVVTFKLGSAVGNSTGISAKLQVSGQAWKVDGPKAYDYYAGPVKAKAAGKCIRWGGNYGELNGISPWEHCG